jgi:hypothetical protein
MNRILWYVFATMLAFIATGSELDRASRRTPALSRLVPAPFRSFAQQHLTEASLAAGDAGNALPEAQRLIRRRPIPAENLFLLAWANQVSRQQEASARALALSAERGWRSPQVQQAMVGIALYNRSPDTAAARLLALWSTGADASLLDALARQVFQAPGGPEAFGKYLAGSRFSQATIVQQAPLYASPPAYARMIRSAQAAGARFDCAMLEGQAARLTRQGHVAQAKLVLGPNCPPAQAGQPAD